jgi:hypothetical protein
MEPETIAELLRQTGADHHQAFIDANGEDPDWPSWYAERLSAPLGQILGRSIAPQALAQELVRLDREARAAGVSDWPRYYAERLAATDPNS